MPTSRHRLAIGAGLLTSAMIGGSVPLSGMLVDYPLLTGQSMRYGVGAVLLVAWATARRIPITAPKLRDAPALLAIVAVGMLGFNAFMITAQRHADPGLVAAVLGGSPLVLAAIAPLMAKRRPAVRTLLGASVVVAGVVVLSGGGSWEGPGLLLAVLTMLCEAGFTLFAVGVVRRIGGLSVALWCHVIATVAGACLAVVLEPWRAPTAREWTALSVVAVLTVVAFVIWYQAVGVLGADRAGVLIGVMPAAGLVVSVAVGSQGLTLTGVAGVAVVGAGCVIGLLSRSPWPSAARRGPRPAAAPSASPTPRDPVR
ncbi:DMT family transporter [Actinokineospora globicatena]|uniref:DMT family transporter n=1 Tax=Actinokineospora globicatena TaxID=103729 RepID=UPI0020A55AFB|nr:DMT family transporter [Actinokineospora globicatena]MCP2300553.1 Permease of the drug/metabolite transporter (DMT) superfamily [Actinokineospora globicatena]GLW81097.1 membrane protein [Actinokineospora globicatena]GLW88290.1 membrane protein [Actinokineospora globicatena]